MDCYKLRNLLIAIAILICCSVAHAQSGPSSVTSIYSIKNAGYCSDTSVSANTITCSTVIGFGSYVTGMSVDVRVANNTTGASTLNINGIGASAIEFGGIGGLTSVTANLLVAGGMYRFTYDGTQWVLQGNIGLNVINSVTVTNPTFGAINDGACADATTAVTSAQVADKVVSSWPSTLEAGLFGIMFVPSAGNVTIRLCNLSGGSLTPASHTYGISVVRST